uniref:Uncharacterized protein n=1 Tax=Knipowitschia caucasica TaxID=637954 RepID=A0AAV2LHT5_KNICA
MVMFPLDVFLQDHTLLSLSRTDLFRRLNGASQDTMRLEATAPNPAAPRFCAVISSTSEEEMEGRRSPGAEATVEDLP